MRRDGEHVRQRGVAKGRDALLSNTDGGENVADGVNALLFEHVGAGQYRRWLSGVVYDDDGVLQYRAGVECAAGQHDRSR